MKLRIEVTAEDIKNGVRRGTRRCPVAIAVSRAFPGKYVVVGANGYIGVFNSQPPWVIDTGKGSAFVSDELKKASKEKRREEYSKYLKTECWLTKKVTKFIADYDGGKKVKPFSLTMDFNKPAKK